ncbi:MAG: ThuA domain-containing protein [Verrucomicrobiales bacterium]
MKFATWVQADCTLDFTGLDRQPKGMLRFFPLFVGALLGSFFLGQTLLGDHHEGETHPIKALLVTGGCCHNYPAQTQALQEGLSPYAKIDWTVIHEGGNGTRGKIALYDKEDWAKQFDVVVHNECFADTKDEPYVQRITQAHQAGVPAVVIHCAMHTYRAAPFDDWRQFLGVTSRRHDHQDQYPVQVVAPNHPIMKGFPEDWTSPKDELYIVEKLWPTAQALTVSISQRDGKAHPVMWVNTFGKAKVFGTTYGHNDGTFRDPAFLLAVGRGLLWACDRLEEEE